MTRRSAFAAMFSRPSSKRRVTIAAYPDGTEHEMTNDRRYGWSFRPGSYRESLRGAKAEARSYGATVRTEIR